jgi:hypothetical protein
VKEKYDYREIMREIAEDEKVTKTRPVLLTQREIKDMLLARQAKNSDGRKK